MLNLATFLSVLTLLSHNGLAQSEKKLTVRPMTEAERASEGFDPGQSYGLFVGVRQFGDAEVASTSGLSEIPHAVDDAVDLAHLFAFDLGLIAKTRVVLALSGAPSKPQSAERLKALTQAGAQVWSAKFNVLVERVADASLKAGEKGILVMSFSTHGFTQTQGGDRLLGQDSSLMELDLSGLPVSRVLERVSQSKCPRRLVLLDACRERVSGGEKPAAGPGMSSDLMEAIGDAKGMVVMSGTTAGGYSYDGDENGVFTGYLMEGLMGGAKPDERGFITPQALADYVNQGVKSWVAQNKPQHVGKSQGISYNVEDPTSGKMPLAVSPERVAKRTRRQDLLKALREQTDFKVITGAMSDEMASALEKSASGSAVEGAILGKLEILDKVGAAYREDLARWWTQEGKAMCLGGEGGGAQPAKVPPTATSTATPTPTSAPTAVPKPEGLLAPAGCKPKPGTVGEPSGSGWAKEVIHDKTVMELVYIPPGDFMMGSAGSFAELAKRYGGEAKWYEDEQPQHRVRITKGFYLGKYEVTTGEYKRYDGSHSNGSMPSGDRDPVVDVSWEDASKFCGTMGLRLPTEAEWEYACRAGSSDGYSFGDDVGRLGDYAWFDGNSGKKTHPVGQKPGNGFGLCDMHGNVWEWCSDWYGDKYYASSPEVDPPGPSTGSTRVDRGGGWSGPARGCRSAGRGGGSPVLRGNFLGFRAVLPAVR